MKSVPIRLDTISCVRKFVDTITRFGCDFEIVLDRYAIDAKSIMGIFSLDLSRTLTLNIDTDDASETENVMNEIREFVYMG